MGWITAFLPSGPRRRKIDQMDEVIRRNEVEADTLSGHTKNNLQAVQSGARVLDTMSGMLRLVSEAQERVNARK